MAPPTSRHGVVPGPNAFAQRHESPRTSSFRTNEHRLITPKGLAIYSPSIYGDYSLSIGEPGEAYTSDVQPRRSNSSRGSQRPSNESKRNYPASPGPPPDRSLPQLPTLRPSAESQRSQSSEPGATSHENVQTAQKQQPQSERSSTENRLPPLIQPFETSTNNEINHKRVISPSHINLKLAKAYGSLKNSKLQAINNEMPATQACQDESLAARRKRFDQGTRPVFPTASQYFASRKASNQSDTAAPRLNIPNKAARVLGTSSQPNKRESKEEADELVSPVPSAEILGLAPPRPPRPPFAEEGLSIQKHRDNSNSPGSCRNYSPRILRDTSDPRLLTLNDRIASRTSNAPNFTTSTSKSPSLSPPQEESPPPSPPLKSPNQLRRVKKRISNESTTPRASAYFETRNGTSDKVDYPIYVREGLARSRKPELVKNGSEDAYSTYGSLHGASSYELRSPSIENEASTNSQPNSGGWPLKFGHASLEPGFSKASLSQYSSPSVSVAMSSPFEIVLTCCSFTRHRCNLKLRNLLILNQGQLSLARIAGMIRSLSHKMIDLRQQKKRPNLPHASTNPNAQRRRMAYPQVMLTQRSGLASSTPAALA